MRSTERRIYHFDMQVRRRGHETHLPHITKIIEVWKERSEDSTAEQKRSSEKYIFKIDDVVYLEGSNCACLLISVNDKASPDSVYGDFKTGEKIINKKSPTQGGMHSVHLLVSTDPYKPDTYFCLVEYGPKLNQSNIKLLLNHVLHDEYVANHERFSYPDPSGRKKRDGSHHRIGFLPRIELIGHPSKELIQSLESGRLNSIVLLSDKEESDFAGNPYLVIKEHQLHIGIKPNLPKSNRFQALREAVSTESERYASARVSFKGADGSPQSVKFNIDDGSIIDTRFVKSEIITGITPPLADACTDIARQLVSPMLRIVLKHRNAHT